MLARYYIQQEVRTKMKEDSKLYRVLGRHTSVPMIPNSVDIECNTMKEAKNVAKRVAERYSDVYIREETEWIYQML